MLVDRGEAFDLASEGDFVALDVAFQEGLGGGAREVALVAVEVVEGAFAFGEEVNLGVVEVNGRGQGGTAQGGEGGGGQGVGGVREQGGGGGG